MNTCSNGWIERWEAPANSPAVGAWTLPPIFSPYAPWAVDALLFAHDGGQNAQLIVGPSDLYFQDFMHALCKQGEPEPGLPPGSELVKLLGLSSRRTAQDETTIEAQAQYGGLMGAIHSAAGVKLMGNLYRLINVVESEAKRVLFHVKRRINRVRPYQLLPELAPPFLKGKNFPMHASYPSGHSTQAHLMVNVIEDVLGTNKAARDMACTVGENRELAGLHYPSDTRGGNVLAGTISDALRANAEYQRWCATARAEYP